MIVDEIKGDLITLALDNKFDAIVHGVNCFCKQKSGIAAAMVKVFKTDQFLYEKIGVGDYNKLGMIDWACYNMIRPKQPQMLTGELHNTVLKKSDLHPLEMYVINAYTQYMYATDGNKHPLDYGAVELCFKKINHIFKGYNIGIPYIGAGKAGGDWNLIWDIIDVHTPNVNVTVVKLS